jgi:integrase
VDSYRRAITRACDAAFPPPAALLANDKGEELEAWRKEHHWHPHQLRHNAATLIRELYGLEAAGAVLGQKSLSATQIYAERNLKAAERVMNEVG